MRIERRAFLAGAAAALTLPGAGLAQTADHMAELYKLAREEGELTWYAVYLSSEQAEAYGAAFTKSFPGIKVNAVRLTAQVAYQSLNQDLQSRTNNCDVFASTDLGHYVSLKERKMFMPYVVQNARFIDERFRNLDPDNTFHTANATTIQLLYNTNKVKAADAPKSWRELTDPKWRNQVSVGHPGFSGFVGTWTVEMRKLYGWDFFEKLAANRPQVGRSIIDTVTTLVSGERSVAAGPAAIAMVEASRGNPIAVAQPEEGAVLIISPMAIMAGTKRPNAAKLFMEWIYGPEVAAIEVGNFNTPLRPDVTLKPGVLPLVQMKTIRPTVPEIVSGIPEVAERWRDIFGV